MMLLGKSQQAEWVGRSHIIADFIDFAQPFDVLLCSKAIHNVLVSTCENHFGGKCSSVDDARKGFFKIKKPVLDDSLLRIEIDQLIGKLASRAMVEDELAALHVTEDFVAAIYGSDERNVALVVAPAYYEPTTPTINNDALIEKPAECLTADDEALINFFKENCCGVGGGFIGSGTRIGGFESKVCLHDLTPCKGNNPTSSKSTQQAA